jgi:hypothetical protein
MILSADKCESGAQFEQEFFKMLDKEKTFLIPFPLKTGFPLRYNKYPETSPARVRHHGLTIWNYVFLENLI